MGMRAGYRRGVLQANFPCRNARGANAGYFLVMGMRAGRNWGRRGLKSGHLLRENGILADQNAVFCDLVSQIFTLCVENRGDARWFSPKVAD